MCFEVVNWAESRVRNLFSLCSSFLGAGNDTLSDSTVDEKKRLESLDELYEIRLRKRKVEFNVCWSFEMGQNFELEISSNSLSLLFKLLPKILKISKRNPKIQRLVTEPYTLLKSHLITALLLEWLYTTN